MLPYYQRNIQAQYSERNLKMQFPLSPLGYLKPITLTPLIDSLFTEWVSEISDISGVSDHKESRIPNMPGYRVFDVTIDGQMAHILARTEDVLEGSGEENGAVLPMASCLYFCRDPSIVLSRHFTDFVQRQKLEDAVTRTANRLRIAGHTELLSQEAFDFYLSGMAVRHPVEPMPQ